MKTYNISIYILTLVITCLLVSKVHASNYSVIADEYMQHYKRSVDVRLAEKVTKDDLKIIAKEIKYYEKTFIAYYLPGMKVDSGAWATTYFLPDLEIKILGLSINEEENILKLSNNQVLNNVIGVWSDERPYMKSVLTIYQDNKKTYIKVTYKDGTSGINEMSENKVSNGTKLIKKNPSFGEYFLIDSENDLHAGDSEGLYLKYKKIE